MGEENKWGWFAFGFFLGMVIVYFLIVFLLSVPKTMEYGDTSCLVEVLNWKIIGCFE